MVIESKDKEVMSGVRKLVVTNDQDHASVAVEKGAAKVVPTSIKSESTVAVEATSEGDPSGGVEKSKEEKKTIVGENVTEKVDLSKENVTRRPGRESWFSERIRFLEEQRKCAKRQKCEKRA